MRVAIYLRLGGQSNRDRAMRLEAAEGYLSRYAKARGWDSVALIQASEGIPGALDDVSAELVAVYDKFAPLDGPSELLVRLQENNIPCVEIRPESIRHRKLSARLKAGRERGARAGFHCSGKIPFGYRKGSSHGRLVVDDDEAAVVRMIFKSYLRLRSTSRLVRLLNKREILTGNGKPWSRAALSWILKNDTYVGRVHLGTIHTRGRHERIVSPIVFNRVQKLLRENTKSGALRAVRLPSSSAHRGNDGESSAG